MSLFLASSSIILSIITSCLCCCFLSISSISLQSPIYHFYNFFMAFIIGGMAIRINHSLTVISNRCQLFFKFIFSLILIYPWVKIWHYGIQKRGYVLIG